MPRNYFPSPEENNCAMGSPIKTGNKKRQKDNEGPFLSHAVPCNPGKDEVKPIKNVMEPLPTEPGHLGLLLANTTT